MVEVVEELVKCVLYYLQDGPEAKGEEGAREFVCLELMLIPETHK